MIGTYFFVLLFASKSFSYPLISILTLNLRGKWFTIRFDSREGGGVLMSITVLWFMRWLYSGKLVSLDCACFSWTKVLFSYFLSLFLYLSLFFLMPGISLVLLFFFYSKLHYAGGGGDIIQRMARILKTSGRGLVYYIYLVWFGLVGRRGSLSLIPSFLVLSFLVPQYCVGRRGYVRLIWLRKSLDFDIFYYVWA